MSQSASRALSVGCIRGHNCGMTHKPPPHVVARLRAAGCVFAEDEAALLIAAASTESDLERMIVARVAGDPLEYVVGWAEFMGIRIAVEPGVFVPRPRTRFLVEQAIARTSPGAIVVDLCCGVGALGAALAAAVDVQLYCADIDQDAVRAASRNVAHVYQGDLFDALPTELRGRIDTLICNTPYVPTAEIELLPREARLYENRVTLDGGADGLDVQRRVAAQAGGWLAPGGWLLVESSQRQSAASAALFESAGLTATISSDLDADATVVIGQRRA